jgi:phosphohistidine phosphatase
VVQRVADAFQTSRAQREASAQPLRILASPRARAQETAAILRGALVPVPGAIEIVSELGGETAIPLSLIAEATTSGVDTVLVGHQPVVEELVKQLLGRAPKHLGFSTATLVGLSWAADGGTWTLVEHLDPSLLPADAATPVDHG